MNRVLKYVLGVLLLILTQTLFAQKVNPFYEDGNIYIKVKASAMLHVKEAKNEIRN
jgi:uncharacterized protein YxeA